jgi:hypothetical protein
VAQVLSVALVLYLVWYAVPAYDLFRQARRVERE